MRACLSVHVRASATRVCVHSVSWCESLSHGVSFQKAPGPSKRDRDTYILGQAGPCPTLSDSRGRGPLRKKKTGSRTREARNRVKGPACVAIDESVPRTVPNCTEPHAVQKCSETAPHWSTSGTVRSTSFALLPPCDLRPPGSPPELPSPLPVSPIGDPGFEPVTAKPAVRTRKQLRHVDKMHEICAAQTG